MKSVQINVTKYAKYVKNPYVVNVFSMRNNKEQRWFEDDKLVSVCAARIDEGFDATTLIDITELVKDGQLVWDVPPGKWMIYVNYLTRNSGCRENYINMVDKQSAHIQIEQCMNLILNITKKNLARRLLAFSRMNQSLEMD